MRRVQERFFLRFHMSLILMATVLSGLLCAKLLLLTDVDNIVIRYPLAVLCAYLVFFLFVKMWLLYLSAAQPLRVPGSSRDVLSALPDFSGGAVQVTRRASAAAGEGQVEAAVQRVRSTVRCRMPRLLLFPLRQMRRGHPRGCWIQPAMPYPGSSMMTGSS